MLCYTTDKLLKAANTGSNAWAWAAGLKTVAELRMYPDH